MKNTNNERVSPYGIRIHTDNSRFELLSSSFIRYITTSFSISLSPVLNHRCFYTIDAKDESLKDFLSFEDDLFLEYGFDKILSSLMHNLLFANKTFLEIVFSKNEKNEIVGLSLCAFDAIKIASSKKHSWFLSRKTDKKIVIFKLEKNKYIEFNIKELEFRRNHLKRIIKKLRKVSIIASTKLVLDEKMENKFSFYDYQKKQNLLILQYPRKIGWLSNLDNHYLSESYSLFRHVRLREFQTKCLSFFIKKINAGINNISDITKASGTIKTTVSFPKYQEEWERYEKGSISPSELSDIIFPKYSNKDK